MSLSMDQGRGNAYAAAILLVIIGLQSCSLLASAATYTVGDSTWDLGIDYTTWAAAHTFKVGDILFFPYVQSLHDVVVVNKAGYDACSATNAISTFSEGNTNVTLSSTGAHYFLCSIPGHCSGGMKLAVTVTAAASPPTATASPPTASPPTTTAAPPTASPPTATAAPPASAPTPSKTPSSPPAPSSTSTPSSAPSPSSPAPAPSAEAPASAPTPSSPAPTPTVGPPSSSPSAPGSTPSSTGTPVSSPPPPSAAPSLLASASIGLLLALWAVLFV